MSKNMAGCLQRLALFGAVAGVFVAAAGCGPKPAAPPAPPAVPAPKLATGDAAASASGRILVYKLAPPAQAKHADPNGLLATPVVFKSVTPKDAPRRALEALTGINSPLPPGTRILGLEIDPDGLATVNFSGEFQSNFPGGDEREAQVIDSVLATLGQFPQVHQVQFLVKGEKISSLGGTQDLSDPLPAIRPDTQQMAADGKGV